ncbi:MAG: putative metalloprotease CJM1_0395 family protein [Bermanella sp.]
MNIQFGSATATPHNPIQGSEARVSVAVPADAESTSTTSFTPVTEIEEAPKGKQENVTQGVEERRANDLQRSQRRQVSEQSSEVQQVERQEQRAVEESQVDRAIQARRQEDAAEQRQLEAELQQIQKLAERDREVRAHEQAHSSVGGEFAGAISLSTERGPDGKNYAVAGEVSIDISKVANDPQATLDKSQTVRNAALAPADPSSQDRRVAALANQMAVEARADIEKLVREGVAQEAQEREEDVEQRKESEMSDEERLDAQEKAQLEEQQSQLVAENTAAELIELNEKLTRVQAQLQEISQIDDKVQASDNLLDIVT